MVDKEQLYAQYKSIKPWLIQDEEEETKSSGGENVQSKAAISREI